MKPKKHKTVRMPEELLARIKQTAAKEKRTDSAVICNCLEDFLPPIEKELTA